MVATLSSTLFSAPVTQLEAADLNPRFLAEPVDSGEATTQGLTWFDPATGFPAADENDTITVFADATIGGTDYAAGQTLRAVRTTAGGIGVDWASWSATTTSGNYETPADGAELEINTYYSGSTETWTLPTAPNDGDWVLVSNHAVLLPTPPGLLDKVTVVGPLRIGSGTDIPGAPLAAGTTVRFVYKASIGRWRAAFNFGVFEALTDIHSGMELRSGVTYEIDSKAVGVELFLPEAQLGSIRVRLANGSTHPVTIRQAAAETSPAVIRNHVNDVNDSLLIDIDNTGKVAEFAGYADANRWLQYLAWDTVSQTTNILDYIRLRIRSAGTNSGSNISLTFFDEDGNSYADGDWVYSANLVQYAGGTATIITDKAPWLGTLGVGRNKDGTVDFYHIGPNPKGLSRVEVPSAVATVAIELDVEYEGTNYSDNFANWADLSQPLYWTTRGVVEASDQAAPFLPATEYVAGSVFSFPEPDAADPDVGVWFNWRVQDGQTVLDTEVPNGTAAEFETIKPKLERFGVGSATDDAWLALADTGTPEINRVNVLANEGETFADPATAGLAVRDKFTVVEPQGATEAKALTRYWDGTVYRTIEEDAVTAKNALVYPVGNFTALPVNDSGVGADGAVYKIPTVDALQITLPNAADMNAAEGIYRVRVSGDWAALSTQTTVLSFTDDTANGVDMGTGLPDDGNEWLDLVFDAANDKWIATSGGDVTLTQIIPSYAVHTEVPGNVRLYLIDGTGASAEGLYRKETGTNVPNYVG